VRKGKRANTLEETGSSFGLIFFGFFPKHLVCTLLIKVWKELAFCDMRVGEDFIGAAFLEDFEIL